jgi:lipopolysaccharide transport system permease protein
LKTVIDSSKNGKIDRAEIIRFAGLFKYLALRDVMVRYKQTWAGVLWAVIRPMVNIVIFGLLSVLISEPDNYEERFLTVSCGVILWQLISTGITEVSNSLVNNSNILTKVYFPKIILPASSILVSLIDFIISLLIFLIMYFILRGSPEWRVVLFPLFILYALVFCLAVGLFFATLNVKYRDIKFLLPFILQVAFYASPVFLSTEYMMNFNIPVIIKKVYLLNPVVGIMDGFRFCFFGGNAIYDWPMFIGSIALTFIILIFGVNYFLRFEKSFADFI